MQRFTLNKLIIFLSFALLLIGCRTTNEPVPEEQQEEGIPDESVTDNDPVPPDATLETVTWNINWYGDGTYTDGQGNGPSDELQQTKNIIQITDSLKADLYAFQEVYSQKALNDITENMQGYRGFVADHIDWIQKTAFVFNDNTIDSLSSGPIQDVRSEYQEDWDYYWADRLPMYFEFTYSFENTEMDFFAIVIHGKANTGSNSAEYEEAYERRKNAAEGLYYYLKDEKPNRNIILLGDYNDDVDESIFYYSEGDYAETPYYQFVNDTENFDVITKKLSDAGESASINYPDIIDHITISDELFSIHVESSTDVFEESQSFITNYGETTSDHLPVWAKFDVTK